MKSYVYRCIQAGLLLAPVLASGASVGSELRAGDLTGRGAPEAACAEPFEDIASLYAENGWLRFNTSGGSAMPAAAPQLLWWALGASDLPDGSWSNVTFGAQSGSPLSRAMSAGFTNAAFGEFTSTWLVTPPIDFAPGATLAFWTRATTDNVGSGPERLIVRACTDGDCADVGATAQDLGAFTTPLLTINEALAPTQPCHQADPSDCTGYPYNWRRYTVQLPESGRGRVAFHNHYPDTALPWIGNGLAIAIDTVEITGSSSCPLRHNRLFDEGFDARPGGGYVTQSRDTTSVLWGRAVACHYTDGEHPFYRRNAWLRRFDLATDHGLSGRVAIESLDVGIDAALGSQYVPVRLYAIERAAPLAYANMTLIGQAELPVYSTDQATIRNLPITGTIADAGSHDLVVEISSEYGEAFTGFLPGLNRAGQTAPTYYSGACSSPATGGAVLDAIVDQTALISTVDNQPFYDAADALVLVVHAAERPSGGGTPAPAE